MKELRITASIDDINDDVAIRHWEHKMRIDKGNSRRIELMLAKLSQDLLRRLLGEELIEASPEHESLASSAREDALIEKLVQ